MTVTHQLDFLRVVGMDVAPDPKNIPYLLGLGWTQDEVAQTYGVSRRTIQRWLSEPNPCPGERCLTMTPGGRTCHFCRRTP